MYFAIISQLGNLSSGIVLTKLFHHSKNLTILRMASGSLLNIFFARESFSDTKHRGIHNPPLILWAKRLDSGGPPQERRPLHPQPTPPPRTGSPEPGPRRRRRDPRPECSGGHQRPAESMEPRRRPGHKLHIQGPLRGSDSRQDVGDEEHRPRNPYHSATYVPKGVGA